MGLNKENLCFFGIAAAITAIFFYYILGVSGMVSALGIILLFVVPAYLILDNFNLEKNEKAVFSFFIGAGVFPSIAYWLGTVISFRISIFITFFVLAIAGFAIRKFYRKEIF